MGWGRARSPGDRWRSHSLNRASSLSTCKMGGGVLVFPGVIMSLIRRDADSWTHPRPSDWKLREWAQGMHFQAL